MPRVHCVPLLVALTGLACGQQQQAVIVTTYDGGLNVLGEYGQLIRTVKTNVPLNGTFSIDRQVRYGVGVQGRCHGEIAGSLQQVDLLKDALLPIQVNKVLPYQPPPGEVEVYQDPSVSPSGQHVAFIVRPCNTARKLDGVEAAGFVVVWERGTAKARLLQGSRGEDGWPLGSAMNPTWSDDERYLFVNYETGFRVMRATDGSIVGADLPPDASASWSSAQGWIGTNCIVYMHGPDFDIAHASPRMVVNVASRKTDTLAKVLGYTSSLAPEAVRWPFIMSRIGDELEMLSFAAGKPTVRRMLRGGDSIQLLPNALQVPVPPFCR